MDWITVIWVFNFAIYLLMAAIHLVIYFNYREQRRNLMFIISALSAAAVSLVELYTVKFIRTPDDYGLALRTGVTPFTGMLISVVWFQHLYFNVGRRSLIWLFTGLRLLIMVIGITSKYGFNFERIDSLSLIPFLNGVFPIPNGQIHPRSLIGTVSLLIMMIIAADFAITIWRRNHWRQAILVGGSIFIFDILVLFQGLGAFWAYYIGGFELGFPVFSFYFILVALAMSYEVGSEVIRASWLSRELKESEQRMGLAIEAADLGIWTCDIPRKSVFFSENGRQLFGLGPAEYYDTEDIKARIYPDDREALLVNVRAAINGERTFQLEVRIFGADGEIRWLASRGEVEIDSQGQATFLRGVVLDITTRKQAEESLRDLNGLLIRALEEERARLARELHDDLSQRLALLSVEQDVLGSNPQENVGELQRRIKYLSQQTRLLSRDVSRLSHELHPSRLVHFGLIPGLRSYCRDLEKVYDISIDFRNSSLPLRIPAEVGICIYRLAQESLQNVVRHSGSKSVSVTLSSIDGEIRLLVVDAGCGFDLAEAARKRSLGLTSMKERVRLVKGRIEIDTVPGSGTRLDVRIPLPNVGLDTLGETDSPEFIPVRAS